MSTKALPMLLLRVSFDQKPSPLLPVDLQWQPGEMGVWVKSVFEAEKAAILTDLDRARVQSPPPRRLIEDLQTEARWCVQALSDIDSDLAVLAGERRMRLFRGGQAEWVQRVVRDAQADLYEDLGDNRANGLPEDSPQTLVVRQQLQMSFDLLKDIDHMILSLVGPDEDPRDNR